MKKIKIISAVMVAMLSAASCNDEFLSVTPLGVLSEATLSNAAGVNLVLTGAYSLLDGVQTNVGSPFPDWTGSADNWVYGSVASDDAYKGSNAGDQPEISLIEAYTHTSDLTHFRGKWRAVYDGVARSNDVIQLAPKATDLSDADKNWRLHKPVSCADTITLRRVKCSTKCLTLMTRLTMLRMR